MNQDPIDALIALYLKLMPKTVYLVKNGSRFEEIACALRAIKSFIESVEPDAKFNISHDNLTGTSLSLEVTCTLLSFTRVDEFCAVIQKVDSIDITPLTNGDLSVVFSFEDAFIPAPPASK